MKNTTNLFVTFVVLLVCLSACAGPAPNETLPETPQPKPEPAVTATASPSELSILDDEAMPGVLREIAAAGRAMTFPTQHTDFMEIIKEYQTSGLDAERDAEIAEYLKTTTTEDLELPKQLSHTEVAEELEFLFDMLKHGYAGYQYFGGDQVFSALKQNILSDLSQMSDPVSNDSYINELLIPNLKTVIGDNHFWLGDHQRIGVKNWLYLNEDWTVQKTDEAYITEAEGREYKVVLDEDWSVVKGLMPTLTQDGELAWTFGWMISGEDKRTSVEMDITLVDMETQEETVRTVRLLPVSDQYRDTLSKDTYTVKEVDGIAVLENRRLWDEDRSVFEGFAATGDELRDEPVLVLDLRGCAGGSSINALNWIKRYQSQLQPSFTIPFTEVILHSATTNALNTSAKATSPPEWQVNGYSKPTYLSNDNLLIVLTDNQIGSSGEIFTGLLHQFENVVFVGTNTMGCLLTGNEGTTVLPISKQTINFGLAMFIRPDLSQFEGVGFMPDLWVPPGESLERVIKFVERYKITDEKKG